MRLRIRPPLLLLRRDRIGTQISRVGGGRLTRGKKQGGLQQAFVKFSLGLKGQQGSFFAKQQKKEKRKPICENFAKFSFSLIFQRLTERSTRASVMLSSPKCPCEGQARPSARRSPRSRGKRQLRWRDRGSAHCVSGKEEASLFYSPGSGEEVIKRL